MLNIKKTGSETFPSTENLFQTSFWGKVKSASGQKALYFWVDWQTEKCLEYFPLLVLLRKTSEKSQYAYVPRGPFVKVEVEERGLLLEELSEKLKEFLPQNCSHIRFDVPWKINSSEKVDSTRLELLELKMNFGTKNHNLRKASLGHLCANTVIIDLSLPPEKMLEKMRGTTRNSIRRSYKSEVDFTIYHEWNTETQIALKEWYSLYVGTAKRKNFFYDNYEYFERLFNSREDIQSEKIAFNIPLTASVPPPNFYLFTATKNKMLLSGLILAVVSKSAYYMYAASSLEERECMPNYGLQWEVMRFARSLGCTQYDLMGIPPNNNKNHPMAGLFIFKTGFGGNKIRFAGAWDYILDKEKYISFKNQESLYKA